MLDRINLLLLAYVILTPAVDAVDAVGQWLTDDMPLNYAFVIDSHIERPFAPARPVQHD